MSDIYIVKNITLDCPSTLEYLFKTIDPLNFYMYKYKTMQCSPFFKSHDHTRCIYYHGKEDYRRPPDKNFYIPELCPNGEYCANKIHCTYCHSIVEKLFHPIKFKMSLCESVLNNTKACKFRAGCPYYHDLADKRSQSSVIMELNKIAKPVGCALLQYQQCGPRYMTPYETPYQEFHGDPICMFNSINELDFGYFPHIPQHTSLSTKPLDQPKEVATEKEEKKKEKDKKMQELSDDIWRQLDS